WSLAKTISTLRNSGFSMCASSKLKLSVHSEHLVGIVASIKPGLLSSPARPGVVERQSQRDIAVSSFDHVAQIANASVKCLSPVLEIDGAHGLRRVGHDLHRPPLALGAPDVKSPGALRLPHSEDRKSDV